MPDEALVHILVINWNGQAHLEACFSSLLAMDYTNVYFILLDNASDDDSVAYVQSTFGHDPRVGLIQCTENLGWSGANNVGMQAALDDGAEYVVLLNNDTRVEPDFLRVLVAKAESDKMIGALSPRILMYDSPEIINSLGLEASIIGAGWDKGIGLRSDNVAHGDDAILGVCGAAMFIRCSVLVDTGLLPEDFEIYLDDLDLSLRIWGAGYRIQRCDASVVYHKFSATMGTGNSARRKYYLNTRNRSRIVLRNFPLSTWPRTLWAFLLGECKALGSAVRDGQYWVLSIHVRSWASTLLYLPKAVYYRHSNPALRNPEAFWSMILRRPLFFPGIPQQDEKSSVHAD